MKISEELTEKGEKDNDGGKQRLSWCSCRAPSFCVVPEVILTPRGVTFIANVGC